MAPGISVIVPAFNEEAGIAESIRAMLTARYPLHEVVVVNDGSTDSTFDILRRTFDLVQIPMVFPDRIPLIGEVRDTWIAGNGEPLTVICKDNAGRRSDALNAGLNYARHPLVCMVDADSILEEDALLRVVKPFVDDPDRVVGTGGIIRAATASGSSVAGSSRLERPTPGWSEYRSWNTSDRSCSGAPAGRVSVGY